MRSTPARVTQEKRRRADTLDMLRSWIRDLWGKHTEKKALTPEVRSMLVDLDGVYEQNGSGDSRPTAAPEQIVPETHKS